jgi:hypothetical protein
METILLLAVILLLLVIAFELSVLIQRFDRFPSRILSRQENKKEGPTINVNVGTVSTAPNGATNPGPSSAVTSPSTPEIPEEPEPEPEPRLPPPKTALFSSPVNRSPSGLGVVECPKCKAENSTFRTECFNCGAKL